MMVDLYIEGGNLIVEMQGLDKVWSFKSTLTIPLINIRGAKFDPSITPHPEGLRMLGTSVPGVINAGTFVHDGKRAFWDVHNPAKCIVIDLKDNQYDQLVLEVEDPAQVAASINSRIL